MSAVSEAARRASRARRAARSAVAAPDVSPRAIAAANAHSARTAGASERASLRAIDPRTRRGHVLDGVMEGGEYRPEPCLARARRAREALALRRNPKGLMIGAGLPPDEVRRATWSAL